MQRRSSVIKNRKISISHGGVRRYLLYLVIVLIQYAIKPRIKMYEVLEGDIANDSYYTGLILRTETVVNSEGAGYVNYYLQEKEKAAVGDLVYTVDAEAPWPIT